MAATKEDHLLSLSVNTSDPVNDIRISKQAQEVMRNMAHESRTGLKLGQSTIPLFRKTQDKLLPTPFLQIAVEVNSHKTELICCKFEDRIFCIVTQYQKLGMLVDVTRDNVLEETETATPTYSTRVLLGKDEPMTHVLAKTLTSKLDVHKPIILAMALKDSAPSSVKKLAEYLTQLVNI